MSHSQRHMCHSLVYIEEALAYTQWFLALEGGNGPMSDASVPILHSSQKISSPCPEVFTNKVKSFTTTS